VPLFEPALLSQATAFFREEGNAAIRSLDATRFLALCEKRLCESADLCVLALDARSRRALVSVVENELLRPHTVSLLDRDNGGLRDLLDDDRTDDLRRMFSLFERVDSLEALRTSFAHYVRQTGESIVRFLCFLWYYMCYVSGFRYCG
jgi:hypothetical protein